MKSFAIYWARLSSSNEQLEKADTIKLSLEEFRKQLERAWRDGRQSSSEDSNPFDLVFGGGASQMMTCYIAGPMRGLPLFNFPAFDAARDRIMAAGHEAVSPADMDRISGFDPLTSNVVPSARDCMRRDVNAILDHCDTIALLPGWERSKGSAVEVALGQFLNLKFIDAITLKEINL